MQIQVYISKNFANETSPLFKSSHLEEPNKLLGGIQEKILRADKSTETTLSELYQQGYTLLSTERISPNGFMLFTQKA